VLLGGAAGFVRAAHLRPFHLPGGDAAVREPRRAALALLWQACDGDAGRWRAAASLAATELATTAELTVFERMLAGGLHAPLTTSAGRLFDGVAALAGLHPRSTFEGQAAMALEAAVDPAERGAYPLEVSGPAAPGAPLELDWRPLVDALLGDLRRGAAPARVAARFHHGLVAAMAEVARRLAPRLAAPRVALTGGCFQNRVLTEGALRRLCADGFEVFLHRRVPANDGGIAFGQVAVAAARLATKGAPPCV
jgi:hydrogenase maturation protein HypF